MGGVAVVGGLGWEMASFHPDRMPKSDEGDQGRGEQTPKGTVAKGARGQRQREDPTIVCKGRNEGEPSFDRHKAIWKSRDVGI